MFTVDLYLSVWRSYYLHNFQIKLIWFNIFLDVGNYDKNASFIVQDVMYFYGMRHLLLKEGKILNLV